MTIALGSLLLVIFSSLAWSGLDSCRKALLRDIEPIPLLVLLTAASVPPFALWAAVAPGPPGSVLSAAYLVPAAGSMLLNVAANAFFMEAVRVSPLSLTIPLLSLTPVCATLLAVPLLGERPGAAAMAGVLLVVVGALWLNLDFGGGAAALGGGAAARPGFTLAALGREPGVPLMAFTAVAWSLTIPLDKLAVLQAGPPLHALILTTGVALGFLVLLAARGQLGRLAQVRSAPRLFVAAVAVSVLALGLQFLALSRVAVGLVETLKRFTGNLMAVAMGRLAFGEAITLRKLLAGLLMAAGVALILT